MAFRLYLVPSVGIGTSHDPRRPKYVGLGEVLEASANAVGATWKDYGREDRFVVGADFSVSDDNFLTSQLDVAALPFDLSQPLTAQQVTATQNNLEAMNIPAQWVTTSLTWITVVRRVLNLFEFIARYEVIYGEANPGEPAPSLFTAGISLNSTFNSLPVKVRSALQATAVDFGFDTTGIVGSTQLRTILQMLAEQFGNKQYDFNGTLI